MNANITNKRVGQGMGQPRHKISTTRKHELPPQSQQIRRFRISKTNRQFFRT